MKIEKISNYVLYGVCAVIVLCFALFMGIGYDNMDDAGHTAPLLTDLIMVLMYLLGLATACLMVWSLVVGARSTAGTNEMESTGIPGGKVTMATFGITVLSIVVGVVLGIGEPDFTTTSGVFTPGYMVTMVDAFMWSMYILAFVSVVAVVVASSGIMTKNATKK